MNAPKMYTYNGETKCLNEWSAIYGVSSATIRKRLNRGWSFEDSLTTPSKLEISFTPPKRWANHIGEKYGMLTVTAFAGRSAAGDLLWLCKCKCGGSRVVQSRLLKITTHCGCQRKKPGRRNGTPPTHEQPCWSCQKYIDGCSWSRKEHLPVEGWIATPTVKYSGCARRGDLHSFAIHYCPEYVSDGTEGMG